MELKSFSAEKLDVKVFETADELGKASADFVGKSIEKAIQYQGYARVILATGTSQFSFLHHLQTQEIDWSKVIVFHLDEYLGLSDSHPASFRKYLKERILNNIHPKIVHLLQGDAENIEAVIHDYESLLQEKPIDIACIGIGENGHIAFNDPPIADFNDPYLVKIAELDIDCRRQQLGEGWFPTMDDVPTHALTLTIPAIMKSKIISCVVPDARKANAVHNTLYGPIHTNCPASILRKHPDAHLWLDKGSYGL